MTTRDGYVTTEDGVRLYFQAAGDGAQTVLIPNGMYTYDDFEHLASGRTLVFFDVRSRGRSDQITDNAKFEKGILHDVDDIDTVRRHFGATRVGLIGHSYVGLTVVLYAMKHPSATGRVVQMGAMPPSVREYPAHLTNVDHTLRQALASLGALEKQRESIDPKEFCEQFWTILRPIYVGDPADAHKLKWPLLRGARGFVSMCDLPNERDFMQRWYGHIMQSIARLNLGADDMARAQAPILIIHGTKDRSSPYGGGRDWALRLPNARLVSIEGAAHVPWIEAPDRVFGSIDTFLNGAWPAEAETVTELEPTVGSGR